MHCCPAPNSKHRTQRHCADGAQPTTASYGTATILNIDHEQGDVPARIDIAPWAVDRQHNTCIVETTCKPPILPVRTAMLLISNARLHSPALEAAAGRTAERPDSPNVSKRKQPSGTQNHAITQNSARATSNGQPTTQGETTTHLHTQTSAHVGR